MRKWYGRDRGLTTRMGLTIFGLGLVYVLFIGAMIAAGVGAITILVIAGGFAVAQLLFGDKIALASMRAKVTTPEEQPELHAMIERLCQLADIPKPRDRGVGDGHAQRVRRRATAARPRRCASRPAWSSAWSRASWRA